MTRYSEHRVVATVQSAGQIIPVSVKRARVTMDDSWAPYIQGELVCSIETDEATLDLIDPRDDVRLAIVLDERVGESGTLGDLTTDPAWGTGTLGTLFVSGTLGDITDTYFEPWNDGADTGSRLALDVGVRGRQLDHMAKEMTLTFASDEALLQDWALLATVSETPGSTSVKTAALYALGKIGATLDASSVDGTVDDAGALTWFPGTTGWDYVEALAQTANLRLWCDEQRVWRLDPRDTPLGDPTVLNEFTEAGERIDRDGQWFDGVVVTYEWTDDSDVRRTRRDIAGGSAASRIRHVLYRTPYPGKGAAKRMLDRGTRRGRILDLEAVSRYTVTPNGPLTAYPPDTAVQTGIVQAVEFTFPENRMRVTSRGLVDTDLSAWLLIPTGESWLDQPVGESWLEEQIGV